MIKKLGNWAEHWSFWFAICLTVVGMESVALFYQYVLEENPCKLCIHVRAYLLVLLTSGVLGLVWNRKKRLFHTHGLVGLYLIGVSGVIGAGYSAYQAVQAETALFATCGFDAGFPEWLQLDQWVPWMFEPKVECGNSPSFFGLMSLNEAQMYASIAMFIIATIVLAANIYANKSKK